MPARHTPEQEHSFGDFGYEPTEEYYGICSDCHGSGEISAYETHGRYTEPCPRCGGDGRSELIEDPTNAT